MIADTTNQKGLLLKVPAATAILAAIGASVCLSVWPLRVSDAPSAPAVPGTPAQPEHPIRFQGAGPPPLDVVVFSAAGCAECGRIQNEVIPDLEASFGSAIAIHRHDVADSTAYRKLIELERRTGSDEPVTAKLFVGGHYLAGADLTATQGAEVIRQALAERSRHKP